MEQRLRRTYQLGLYVLVDSLRHIPIDSIELIAEGITTNREREREREGVLQRRMTTKIRFVINWKKVSGD